MPDQPRDAAPTVRGVVCGMMIPPDGAAATSHVRNIAFYFCSEQCRTRFDADPGQFVPELA